VSEVRSRHHLRLVSASEVPTVPAEPTSTALAAGSISDRDLARRLARVELVSMDFAFWRHMSPREHSTPDSGDGAIRSGGRFNPPGSFPVVYGCLSRAAAGAEFRRLARRHPIGIDNLLPRHLYRFRIKSKTTLDLRLSSVQNILGLPQTEQESLHRTHSQLIGEVARALGIDVIVAPSVTGEGAMVAIFPELIPRSSWEFRHVEIWIKTTDIPMAADLGSIVPAKIG
jgi:RES domain-containing protein